MELLDWFTGFVSPAIAIENFEMLRKKAFHLEEGEK